MAALGGIAGAYVFRQAISGSVSWLTVPVVLLLGLLLHWAASLFFLRFERFYAPHTCAKCGYDLSRSSSSACPECGRAADGPTGGSPGSPLN